jgi:hypothetical protein
MPRRESSKPGAYRPEASVSLSNKRPWAHRRRLRHLDGPVLDRAALGVDQTDEEDRDGHGGQAQECQQRHQSQP